MFPGQRHDQMSGCHQVSPYWQGQYPSPPRIASIVGRIPIIPTTSRHQNLRISMANYQLSQAVHPFRYNPDSMSLYPRLPKLLCLLLLDQTQPQALGENSLICCSRSCDVTSCRKREMTSISPFSRTTSSVCVPIEPVDPRIAIFLHIAAPASCYQAYLYRTKYAQIEDDRRRKYHAVKPVQDPAVSRNQLSVILDIMISLDGGRRQISHLRDRSSRLHRSPHTLQKACSRILPTD